MPKKIDHALRRHQIAEAVWKIAAREGLEAVSLSRVAQEAAVSKGRVQHYFDSRDQLLTFTMKHLRERVGSRLTDRLAMIQPVGPMDTLSELAKALMPLDEHGRTESLVNNAFFVRSLAQPEEAELFRRGHTELLGALAKQFAAAQRAGELRDDLDPTREAEILLAVVGGISDSLLLGQHTADSAQALLDYHLNRLTAQS